MFPFHLLSPLDSKGYIPHHRREKLYCKKGSTISAEKSLYNQILEIREEVKQAEKVKTCIEPLQEQENDYHR